MLVKLNCPVGKAEERKNPSQQPGIGQWRTRLQSMLKGVYTLNPGANRKPENVFKQAARDWSHCSSILENVLCGMVNRSKVFIISKYCNIPGQRWW